MNIYVKEPYFSQIKSGKKIYEGRLYAGKWRDVLLDDLFIVRSCEDKTGLTKDNAILKIVSEIKHYGNFREAFEELGEKLLPGITDIEEAQKIYDQFYTLEQMENFSVIVFKLT